MHRRHDSILIIAIILRSSIGKQSSVALLARDPMTNCKWVTRLGLSHRVWKIALCLTVLSDLDVELAVSWLAQRRRRLKRQSGIRKNASLQEIRWALLRSLDVHAADEMWCWIDPERPALGDSALRQATNV